MDYNPKSNYSVNNNYIANDEPSGCAMNCKPCWHCRG